jgi:hypothetical protein
MCDAQGFMVLNIGRNDMLGKRGRESVLKIRRAKAPEAARLR